MVPSASAIATVTPITSGATEKSGDVILSSYLDAVASIERGYRRLLNVIKDELDRRERFDINGLQALLIYRIGDQEMTATELRTRGCYQGSNVSYNIKKLIQIGCIDHRRSREDRRTVRISLTQKGSEIRDIVAALFEKQAKTVEKVGEVKVKMLSDLNESLRLLDRFWLDMILYRL